MNTATLSPGKAGKPMPDALAATKEEIKAGPAKNTAKVAQLDQLEKPKSKGPQTENKAVSDYLKQVSRLENGLGKPEFKEEDLTSFLKNLNQQVGDLKEHQKKQLLKLEFFQKQGIKTLDRMGEVLEKLFADKDEKERIKGFDLLKSPEFVSLVVNNSQPTDTYSPQSIGKASQNGQAAKATPPGPEQTEPQAGKLAQG